MAGVVRGAVFKEAIVRAAASDERVLRGFYARNARVAGQVENRLLNLPFDRAVAVEGIRREVGKLPGCVSSDVRELDRMRWQDVSPLFEVLAVFPPEMLFEAFGCNLALWVWMNNRYSSNDYNPLSAELLGFLSKALKIDARFLKLSRDGTRDIKGETTVANLLRCCELMELMHGNLGFLPVRAIIARSVLKPRETRSYSFRVASRIHEEMLTYVAEERVVQIFQDCPIGLSLFYGELPQAVATFFPISEGKTLSVRQLQPLKQESASLKELSRRELNPKGLFDFDWAKALIEASVEVARRLAFEAIEIVGAANNGYVHRQDLHGSSLLPLKRARKIYDATAERLRFTRGKDGNWRKLVSECERIS